MKYLAAFLLATVAASASPIIQVELTDPGNPAVIASRVTIGGKTDSNVYIGPYTMLINGQSLPALCIDFSDNSYLNTKFNAFVTPVGSSNLSNTYWPTYGLEYKEEAYLYDEILKPGADRTGLQEAAWEITSYGITDFSYVSKYGDNAYIDAALANYSSMSFSGLYIISDTVQHGEQEFIVGTPEPESMALLGAGLVIAAGVLSLKRKQTAASALSSVQR